MSNHLFIAPDGSLYDTSAKDWSKLPPLRENYCCHRHEIKSVTDFKATLRAGPYVWPGGYPIYFICEDDEPLCFNCAREEARSVIEAILEHRADINNGWRVIACFMNYENFDMSCANCEKIIESAYGG